MTLVRKFGFASLLVLGLAGCSVSPQGVSLNPAVESVGVKLVDGDLIKVTATDKRKDKVLGLRGGAYESSEITIANDAAVVMQYALSEGLVSLGFKPSDTSKRLFLHYELVDASYNVTSEKLMYQSHIQLDSRVVLTADQKKHKVTFSTKMSSNKALQLMNEKENESFINQAFADHLQKILTDTKIRQFLKAASKQ